MEEARNLEKIQKRSMNIMGPLSWTWMGINSVKESTSTEIDFHSLIQALEKKPLSKLVEQHIV